MKDFERQKTGTQKESTSRIQTRVLGRKSVRPVKRHKTRMKLSSLLSKQTITRMKISCLPSRQTMEETKPRQTISGTKLSILKVNGLGLGQSMA